MDYARVTVTRTGQVMDESTVTFGQETIPLPSSVKLASGLMARIAGIRIGAALESLGLEYADNWRDNVIRRHECGYVDIPVRRR